ncbi:ABC transporter permease subunit [Halosimplex aquaticum]|uniref:ABC transporter permease subunit n=1 Tax=Halosimplex aquaticum TaxID=3026162 RepID=A0ABD5XZU8_9EURY|nr:ABC transporter permease subunit [Halosimplex aquaticum]
MLEIARFEGRHRARGAAVATAALSAFALLYIFVYPTFAESLGADIDRLLEAYPEALSKAFGVQSLASMEGYLASELYTFGWLLIVGLYFAYAAASLIAADVERERMDMLLSLPVSRARVVLEQFASLIVPLVALSTVVPVVVVGGTAVVDYPVPAADVVALHLLSLPYLTTCAGIGLVASVVFDRASLAQRAAVGVLVALFFGESLLTGTDFEAVGAVSPTRYVDPNAVLRQSEYAVADALVLAVATLALVGLAVAVFRRKDIE